MVSIVGRWARRSCVGVHTAVKDGCPLPYCYLSTLLRAPPSRSRRHPLGLLLYKRIGTASHPISVVVTCRTLWNTMAGDCAACPCSYAWRWPRGSDRSRKGWRCRGVMDELKTVVSQPLGWHDTIGLPAPSPTGRGRHQRARDRDRYLQC